MLTVTTFEAKTQLSELIEKARQGETVVITKGREKKPVAEIKAYEPKRHRRLGAAYNPGARLPDSFWSPLPEEELKLWNEGADDDPLTTGQGR